MHFFTENIIDWYSINKRNLPWRETTDPYHIWLSEIILQQTRINQGLSYYHRFIEEFPDVTSMARSEEENVLKLWQGLGYYTRARNLYATAKIIAEKFRGKFPGTYDELIHLKGIGEYTAAAISSFAFNEPRAVVDGNVFRLLSRFFGIKTPIQSSKAKKEFYVLANMLMDKKRPGLFNQAIMEFGSMQCRPVNPDCRNCCLQSACYAYLKKKVDQLPVKEKKQRVRKRYFNYLVIRQGNSVFIRKRTGKDIWKNLYDFPLIETEKIYPEKKLFKTRQWVEYAGKKALISSVSETYKHVLSHQVIHARFWEIKQGGKKLPGLKDLKKIKTGDFHRYAVPRLIEKYAVNSFLKKHK